MTSSDECYVFITLPNQTQPVTAGKIAVETTQNGVTVGRFVYGKSYLARQDAVALDPVELKLSDRVFETVTLKGLFGAIRDASPDYWGRRVIERHAGKPYLSEMDYLLYSPDDRIGALGFGHNPQPPAPKRDFNRMIDLEHLQAVADRIMREENSQDFQAAQIEELLLLGTSMGGARPKAVVSDNDALWVAKFNCETDRWNNALVEHAMLKLAHECGLNVAESKIAKVGNRDVLLVKRFDREKKRDEFCRLRMISALTVLHADEEVTRREKWSYIALVEEMRRFCSSPQKNARELFSRMVFNALITNTDDHPRNHAFIARDTWNLSPAYDLTPSPEISLERRDLAMVCGSRGRFASRENLLSECRRFLIEPEEAERIISTMTQLVSNRWYGVARSVGLSEKDCKLIQGAFVYPGFADGLMEV
jgi:serine/threonine-protein kinase HipA